MVGPSKLDGFGRAAGRGTWGWRWRRRGRAALLGLWLAALGGGAWSARAALQFDVFLGYDGLVPEASWFPIVCEVKNDGPSFMGVVEVDSNQGQPRRLAVELPTGTLKRFVVPVFAGPRGYTRYGPSDSWDVRLLDERGKLRGEQTGLRPRRHVASQAPLVGALARTATGTPVIRPVLPDKPELQPAVARLLPAIFPDNPLVLEGLDTLYLNSEKAPDLHVTQVNALLAWLNAGGHLIVAVEQLSDVAGTPWLRNVFPCDLKDIQPVQTHPELEDWLRRANWPANLSPSPSSQTPRFGSGRTTTRPGPAPGNPFLDLTNDVAFEGAPLQVAQGTVRDGRVEVAAGDTPLIVTANRGRGRITALLFSPEREPFRSWKNLPTFWARLIEVPGGWYVSSDYNQGGGWSSDGIFGAMIDTRQVHKLPVEWLLLLLIVYLVVIGPLDQFWLKRIGRPMLTWITFPCYVVLFSLLIYFIGYKLRAGESEWNELHLVDVLRNGDHAELRGRTYASVYSPANQRYTLESPQQFATLRGEFAGLYRSGSQASEEKATILQIGDSFKAEIFVPVWTSQLFVSDWWQTADLPLTVSITARDSGWEVKVENRTDRKLTDAQLVIEGNITRLGDLPANQTKTFTVGRGQGTSLIQFVSSQGRSFPGAVGARGQAFGSSESGRIDDLPNTTVAASFISRMGRQTGPQDYMNANNFLEPPGLDLSAVVERGGAVLLAWAGDYAPVKPLYQVTPRRSRRDTLFRVTVTGL